MLEKRGGQVPPVHPPGYAPAFGMFVLKELCHHNIISVFLVTEAGWGSLLSNQVRGRCGFVTS